MNTKPLIDYLENHYDLHGGPLIDQAVKLVESCNIHNGFIEERFALAEGYLLGYETCMKESLVGRVLDLQDISCELGEMAGKIAKKAKIIGENIS